MKTATMALAGLTALLFAAVPATAEEHPFVLVNVVDLFEAIDIDVTPDTGWSGSPETVPPNYGDFVAAPRIGTNVSAVATDGERAWIGGFHNYFNFDRDFGTTENNEASWYIGVGVAEVRNIAVASGYQAGDIVMIPDVTQVGPGLRNTEWISGLDYDDTADILYVAFDDAVEDFDSELPTGAIPAGYTQVDTYIAAVDVSSSGFGTVLWQRTDPPVAGGSATAGRLFGGVAVDPLAPHKIAYLTKGGGFINFLDANNPNNAPTSTLIYDFGSNPCAKTNYRSFDFHPAWGGFFIRNGNALQWILRDTRFLLDPFQTLSRQIKDGGDGIIDTPALDDDVAVGAVNDPVAQGSVIITAGPDEELDSVPTPDDVFDAGNFVTQVPLGHLPAGAECGVDTNGFPKGDAQGQGLAVIDETNLADLDETLILVNNRPLSGPGQLAELVFVNTSGERVAQLDLPCTPVPSVEDGVAFFSMDYHAASGTLVVVDFERNVMFVYKARLAGEPAVPAYDFSRNGTLDLYDLARFQECFTGPETGATLSLNCQRLNTDSDCDVDLDDWTVIADYFEANGGLN